MSKAYVAPWDERWVGTVVPDWLALREDVNLAAKFVYARLARHAGRDGRHAYPRMEVLAREVGVNVKTARRAVQELEEHRLIEVRERPGRSSDYWFLEHPFMQSDEGSTTPPNLGVHPSQSGSATPPNLGVRSQSIEVRPKKSGASRFAHRQQDVEAPALGADPDKQAAEPTPLRPRRSTSPTSVRGLAQRWQRECEKRDVGVGPVTGVDAVAGCLSRLRKDGATTEELDRMIDRFTARPDDYFKSGRTPPYKAFIGSTERLLNEARDWRHGSASTDTITETADNPWLNSDSTRFAASASASRSTARSTTKVRRRA